MWLCSHISHLQKLLYGFDVSRLFTSNVTRQLCGVLSFGDSKTLQKRHTFAAWYPCRSTDYLPVLPLKFHDFAISSGSDMTLHSQRFIKTAIPATDTVRTACMWLCTRLCYIRWLSCLDVPLDVPWRLFTMSASDLAVFCSRNATHYLLDTRGARQTIYLHCICTSSSLTTYSTVNQKPSDRGRSCYSPHGKERHT